MPLGRIAAMKPEPLALTSLASRIGSPATNGARAIMPLIFSMASGRPDLRMKLPLRALAGQGCHCRSPGDNVLPMGMSDFATSTSTEATFGMTWCLTSRGFSERPARIAAMPPAPTAMASTTIRAAFIRSLSDLTTADWPSKTTWQPVRPLAPDFTS